MWGGQSRSAAFAAAVLKEDEGLPLLEAPRAVKSHHPETMLQPALWESLRASYQEDVPFRSALRVMTSSVEPKPINVLFRLHINGIFCMAIAPHSHKHVYTWGNNKADGDGSMKPLLGAKGANLAELTRIGLPVPPGFTITTEVCTYYYEHEKTYPSELQAQMVAGIANMEKIVGTKFGATDGMPLLVSVRSGARNAMPGLMDTILNLGLNDQSFSRLRRPPVIRVSPGTATAV